MMKYVRQFAKQRKTIAVLACLLGGIVILSLYPDNRPGAAPAEVEEAGAAVPTFGQDMTTMGV